MIDAWHATNQIPRRASARTHQISTARSIRPTAAAPNATASPGKYAATDDTGQVKANAYVDRLSASSYSTISTATCTSRRRSAISSSSRSGVRLTAATISYTRFGKLFGRESENTIGFQTRTDDNHIGLAETTNRVPLHRARRHVTRRPAAGSMPRTGRSGSTGSAPSRACAKISITATDDSTLTRPIPAPPPRPSPAPRSTRFSGRGSKTEFYLSYGQGFHSNDLRGALTRRRRAADRDQPAAGQQYGGAQAKTPLLTKAEGYEIGMRIEILPQAERLGGALRARPRQRGDLRRRRRRTPRRAGPADRTGIELSGSYTPLSLAVLQRRFRLHARALHQRRQRRAPMSSPAIPAATFPRRPKMIASAEVAIQNLGAWDGGLRFRYFGPRPLIEDGTVRSGPTALFDARVGYRFSEPGTRSSISSTCSIRMRTRSTITTRRSCPARRRRSTTSTSSRSSRSRRG